VTFSRRAISTSRRPPQGAALKPHPWAGLHQAAGTEPVRARSREATTACLHASRPAETMVTPLSYAMLAAKILGDGTRATGNDRAEVAATVSPRLSRHREGRPRGRRAITQGKAMPLCELRRLCGPFWAGREGLIEGTPRACKAGAAPWHLQPPTHPARRPASSAAASVVAGSREAGF